MLEAFSLKNSAVVDAWDTVVLGYEERKKSRHCTRTSKGEELGWFLERGHVLEDGEVLECSSGVLIKIIAAEESVSEVISDDVHALMRAAYHLGNRHVPLQVGKGFLRFLHDHVLDDMVRGLGLEVSHSHKAFHPENGAYSHGNHAAEGTHSHHHDH